MVLVLTCAPLPGAPQVVYKWAKQAFPDATCRAFDAWRTDGTTQAPLAWSPFI